MTIMQASMKAMEERAQAMTAENERIIRENQEAEHQRTQEILKQIRKSEARYRESQEFARGLEEGSRRRLVCRRKRRKT